MYDILSTTYNGRHTMDDIQWTTYLDFMQSFYLLYKQNLHTITYRIFSKKTTKSSDLSKYNHFSNTYSVHCVLCTMYSVHCTLYIVHCTVYTTPYIQCTLYSVHCTLYSEHCKMHNVVSISLYRDGVDNLYHVQQFTVYVENFTLYSDNYTLYCDKYSNYTVYTVQCSVHCTTQCAPYTNHGYYYTLYSVPPTLYIIPMYTIHYTLYTIQCTHVHYTMYPCTLYSAHLTIPIKSQCLRVNSYVNILRVGNRLVYFQ